MTGDGARMLGVRVPSDIKPDTAGNVHPGIGGMSVSPSVRELPPFLVPRRLNPEVPGATGKNSDIVWSRGEGPFVDGPFAEGLILRRERESHGLVEALTATPLARYQHALAATRDEWTRDEN